MGRDTLEIFRRSGTFLKLLDAFLKIFIDRTWGLTGDTFEFSKCWYIEDTFWNKKSIFLCSRNSRDMILLTRGQKRRSRGIVPTRVRNYSTYYITHNCFPEKLKICHWAHFWICKKSKKKKTSGPARQKIQWKSRKFCYQDFFRAALRDKKSKKNSKFFTKIPAERPCGAKNPMKK